MPDMALVEADGLLFIGDLHLSSRSPQRRRDDYTEAGLRKVEHIIAIANQHRLVPVFSGDIFHRAREPNESLKTRLLRSLGGCWTTCLTNVGNHDAAGETLSDADTLAVIGEPGAPLRVFRQSGPAAEFIIGGSRIGFGFTPYGQDIPKSVVGLFPEAVGVIWGTHHDLAFEGTYPGALEPHAIEGCQLVINGHMHLEKTPLPVGNTLWCNFGSVMRTAIDAAGHEPAVWSFSPAEGLLKHGLPHGTDVFDLTGRMVQEASPGELAAAITRPSVFVEMLGAAGQDAVPVTDEGVLLWEALEARLAAAQTSPEVCAMVRDLHQRVVDARHAVAA